MVQERSLKPTPGSVLSPNTWKPTYFPFKVKHVRKWCYETRNVTLVSLIFLHRDAPGFGVARQTSEDVLPSYNYITLLPVTWTACQNSTSFRNRKFSCIKEVKTQDIPRGSQGSTSEPRSGKTLKLHGTLSGGEHGHKTQKIQTTSMRKSSRERLTFRLAAQQRNFSVRCPTDPGETGCWLAGNSGAAWMSSPLFLS